MAERFIDLFKYLYRVAIGMGMGFVLFRVARYFGANDYLALAATVSACVFLLLMFLIEAIGTAVDSLHPKLDRAVAALEDLERVERERTGRLY